MRRWLLDEDRHSQPFPKMNTESFEGLIISEEDGILIFENRDWIRVNMDYIALGSGAVFAYGALEVGASAKQAVKAAMKLDPNTGGRVQTLEFKAWKGEERSSVEQCWTSIH
jgi:hypothetical protein